MSNETASDQHEATLPSPVEGGRACPVPIDVIALRGARGMRRPKRTSASTGVISADLIERA